MGNFLLINRGCSVMIFYKLIRAGNDFSEQDELSDESANFGCAILIIDGVKRLWIATSSFDSHRHWELLNPIMDNPFLTSATLCEVPNKSRYQTQILDFKGKAGVKGAYDRIVNTECKILNSIAVFLDNIPDIYRYKRRSFSLHESGTLCKLRRCYRSFFKRISKH